MARQEGLIKLKGRIGDLTFYKTKDGYQAREKGGVTASRIANDPKYQRTRENGAEFGRATRAGKLFRTAFKTLTSQLADKRVSQRLMKEMLSVIRADSVNDRGLRQVLDAETELLNGFEFNINGTISSTIHIPYTSNIDRAAGTAGIAFPAFSAKDLISSPAGATHFKFSAAAAVIDFETEVFELNVNESDLIEVKEVAAGAINLSCTLSPASVKPIFLLLGISFFQQVNGRDYSLSNGAFNGLALVLTKGL
ncbi:hypothetical protein ACS5PU_07345 [Pedobacter sp. GSP4]|uniref:hypothetical protein n=1 Tax=Pedobacter sp. GSP4 TaxID=3453716 RepID=UPI003EEAD989